MSKVRTVKEGHLTFYYGIEQGTQEWLELREKYATCSNAGRMLEHHIDFAKEVNRQHSKRTTANATEYTERGHVLEAEVKELLEAQFNNDTQAIIDCAFITNDRYPMGGYSPDGIIVDLETQKFVAPIEVKCFNDWTWRYDRRKGTRVKHYSWKHKRCCEDISNFDFDYRAQFEMEMLMTDTRDLLVVLYNPDAEGDVPKLKIHHIHPFSVLGADGKQHEIYREALAEKLQGKKPVPTAIELAIEKWAQNSKMGDIKWD